MSPAKQEACNPRTKDKIKMQGSGLLAFVILACDCTSKASTETRSGAHYWKCPNDYVFNGTVSKTFSKTMTSPSMRCFLACSEDPACMSLNVCPSGSGAGQSDCTLFSDLATWFCRGLTEKKDCYHAEKSSPCGKGHRLLSNGTCRCDLCYRGSTCRQHVRDCNEAFQLANLAGGYGDKLRCFIQPNGAPSPFLVKCALWGASTTFLIRVQNSSGQHSSGFQWATKSWDEYVKGFVTPDNVFIGLKNLRLLLSQAAYRLNTYFKFQTPLAVSCSAAYANVTLGVQDYALNYNLYTIWNGSEIPGINGFYKDNTPHRFCTVDNDCGTCAKDNGPGWYYNPGCIGYSPFAPIAKWPYFDKGNQTIAETQWYIERDWDLFKP